MKSGSTATFAPPIPRSPGNSAGPAFCLIVDTTNRAEVQSAGIALQAFTGRERIVHTSGGRPIIGSACRCSIVDKAAEIAPAPGA